MSYTRTIPAEQGIGEVPRGQARRLPPALRRWLLSVAVFAAAVLLWELLSLLGGWDAEVFPRPVQVARSLVELVGNGTLIRHSVASLFRVTVGYYLAILLGFPLGVVLGRWQALQDACNGLIQFLRPISPLAWIPLALLWFGIGDRPAVFLIFLSSFFPILVSSTMAVKQISHIYFRVAANFGFSRSEVVAKIIVPAVMPTLLPALRISLGVAWLVVVAAEMIAVKSGLGYLILDSRNALRMDYVMDAMIVIGLIGVVLDRLVSQLARIEAFSWGVH